MKRNLFGVLLIVVGILIGHGLTYCRLQRVHDAVWTPMNEISFTHDIENAYKFSSVLALLKDSQHDKATRALDTWLDDAIKSVATGDVKVGSQLHGIAAASVAPPWQRLMLKPVVDYRTKYPSESASVNQLCIEINKFLGKGN